MGIRYATREAVKAALDSAETARDNARIDRAVDAASRSVDGLCHRASGAFRPTLATRYFDWPDRNHSRSWRLWLGNSDLISVTTVTAGGDPVTGYFLEPVNTGPPYDRVEIDLSSSSAYSAGDTHQRAIAITGLFGYRDDETPVGTLSASLAADTTATASINWSSARVGVGDVLRIDNERVVVTERTMVDSTQNLGNTLAASNADVTVQVSTGSAFAADQVLLIGSERMLVVDVAGNNLTVRRAWDGSVLAPHTSGVDIYTLTGVEVDRAQLGTALAAHNSAAAIYRHDPPSLVEQLTIAEALNEILQQGSGYARTVRSGEAQTDAGGGGLDDLRARCFRKHGRKARIAAV